MEYQINNIEQLTGIKTHTIRIWEKRHKIVSPRRNESNIRYYSEDDLKIFLMIAVLSKKGYKISEIAKLSNNDLKNTVLFESKFFSEYETHISILFDTIVSFNQSDFSSFLIKIIIQFGLEITFCEIILPLIEKVKIYWQTSKINKAQQNYSYNTINHTIIVLFGKLHTTNTDSKNSYLILSTNNFYDNLFQNYISLFLLKHKKATINIGVCNSYNQIVSVVEQKYFENIIVILGENDPKIIPFVKKIQENFIKQNVFMIDYFDILKKKSTNDNKIIKNFKNLNLILNTNPVS